MGIKDSGFFKSIDSGSGDDRVYTASQFAKRVSKEYTTGVFSTDDGEISDILKVSANGADLNLSVNIGYANVEGYYFDLSQSPEVVPISGGDPTNERIDLVILRLDTNDSERLIDIAVLEGAPAASPVEPTLTQTSSIYEIALSRVTVPVGATFLSAPNLFDTREPARNKTDGGAFFSQDAGVTDSKSTLKTGAIISCGVSYASGILSTVMSCFWSFARGERSATIASDQSDSAGTRSNVNASIGCNANGDSSQINASNFVDVDGEESQANASYEGKVDSKNSQLNASTYSDIDTGIEGIQVNASRRVRNQVDYSSAWGYGTGTSAPTVANISTHIFSNYAADNGKGAGVSLWTQKILAESGIISGNLLVGTTTDTGEKLQVAGEVKLGDSSNTSETQLQIGGKVSVRLATGTDSYTDAVFQISNTGTSSLASTLGVASGVGKLLDVRNSGAVLIGTTTNTGEKLQVLGSGNTGQLRLISNTDTDSGMKLRAGGGACWSRVMLTDQAVTNLKQIWEYENSLGVTEVMRLDGGELLLGTTTNTGEKLQVAGKVSIKKANPFNYIEAERVADNRILSFVNTSSVATGGFEFYSTHNSDELMQIKNNGNTLIGTTTDTGERLQVAGKAKVQVTDIDAFDVKDGSGAYVLRVDTTNKICSVGTGGGTTLYNGDRYSTKFVANGGGADIFKTSLNGKPQWGSLYAYEVGTGNFCEYKLYKISEAVGTSFSLVHNVGLSISAVNAGGTIALTGFTNTNNVRMTTQKINPYGMQ